MVGEVEGLQGLRGELVGRLGLQIGHHLPQWLADRIIASTRVDIVFHSDHIVACKTDGPTSERKIRRQPLDRYLVEVVKRILLQHLAILIQNAILIGHLKYWIVGHDRKAGILLFTRDRLKDDLMVSLDTHVG